MSNLQACCETTQKPLDVSSSGPSPKCLYVIVKSMLEKAVYVLHCHGMPQGIRAVDNTDSQCQERFMPEDISMV